MTLYNNCNQTELQQIFGHHLSRICCVTKNAFGTCGDCFRVYSGGNNIDSESVTHIALTSLTLHKILSRKSKEYYTPSGYPDEEAPAEIISGRWDEEQESLH